MAAEYSLTADALLNFGRNPPSGERAFVRWASFADRVGPSILPFVVRPDRLDAVPFKALGMTPVRLSDMVPQPDEMWVLFCFRDSFREALPPDSPLRADGFPLVLEWRRGQGDSELLSGAFHELADRVRGQFGEGAQEWGLHPAFDRYGDAVAFTDPDLFSDSGDSLQIASAWGALAVGLHRRLTGKYHGGWPFPSIQWEWKHRKAAGVAGIAEKLSVAADCGATVVTVAGDQKREAQDLLARLKRSDVDGRYGRLSILAARDVSDPRALARGICDDAVRRVRLRRLMVAAGAFLCAFAAAIGAFFYDDSRIVPFYYADYVDSFGLPQGIFPLKKSELAHRHIHYRFEYRGFRRGQSPHADSAGWCVWNMLGFRRQLVRVVQANAHGYPRKWDHTEYADRPQIQDFKYDRDRRLREIRYGRYNGEERKPHLEKRIELWNEGGIINGLIKMFAGEGQLDKAFAKASLTTVDSDTQGEKSEITKYLVRRDGSGRVVRRLFYNRSDANASDADGIYGFQYELDGLGRSTAQWYLFREGDGFGRRANKKGVAGRKYEYAGRNMHKVAYVDPEGRPISGPHGWMVCIDEFDEFDNNTRSTFYDEKGNITLRADGIAGYTAIYGSSGNETKISYFGVDGKPALHRDGNAGWMAEYDARGNMTKQLFFGMDGKPTLLKNGYAEACQAFDERGNVTNVSYYGVNGKPALHKDGYAELRHDYDERGNVTNVSYYGVNGKPTLLKDGYAEMRMEYGEHGNMTKQLYFGVDGKPVLYKDGYAEICMEYDVRGNRIRESYFGIDGRPTARIAGFAEVRSEYDAHGNRVRKAYFDVYGKPTLEKDGFAGMSYKYDMNGNMISGEYFGVDEKPILAIDGTAGVRWEYDTRGNWIRESYFGVDGNPTLHKNGFSVARCEYDERGNRTKVSYFDADGKPTLHKDGNAGWVAEYDERGNVTNQLYFGVDGKPTLYKDGYAEMRLKYDARGNMTRASYFGVDGKPTLIMYGYAEMCCEYDAHGNKTKVIFFGIDGKPTLHKDGYAEGRMEYDAYGNRILEQAYGVDGLPIVSKQGFAKGTCEYDARGNRIKICYFGIDGKPMTTWDGMAERCMEYDVRGNMTKEWYFDIEGKPTLCKNGYAERCMEYDTFGNLTRERYFGVDEKPTLIVDEKQMLILDGYAEVRMEHDVRGNITRKSFYGVDGKSKLCRDGYAEVRFSYKSDDSVASIEYFDVLGNPLVVREVGVSAEVFRNLPAAELGVREGDIWCRLGPYDVLKAGNIHEVTTAIQACRNAEKELIIARKAGGTYEIHAFKFPVGAMGIWILSKNIPDFDKLERAYRAYCEKEKKAK